jgi:hypothetical protein
LLSNLLQLGGFGGLTYGTYVCGGRGPAGFVAGFALLIIGQAADGVSLKSQFVTKVQAVKANRAAKRSK